MSLIQFSSSWSCSGEVCGHQPRVSGVSDDPHTTARVRDQPSRVWFRDTQGPVIPSSSQHITRRHNIRNKRGELFTAFLTSFDSFHDAVWNMDMMIMYISMFTLSARRAPWAQQARPCILMCSVLGCLDSWWEEREGSDLRDHLEASVNKTRTRLPSLESYGMSCREAIKREEWKQKHCVVISCLCWIDLNISFT